MLRDWLGRLPGAVAAAVYWYAAAWLCFAVTGSDPLDALHGAASAPIRVTVALVMAGAAVVFALVSRAVAARRRER